MDQMTRVCSTRLNSGIPVVTAKGETRAKVALRGRWKRCGSTPARCATWTCRNCYIESSPRNDRLAYLTVAEVATFLDEIDARRPGRRRLIGFTGGEPFMNPEIVQDAARRAVTRAGCAGADKRHEAVCASCGHRCWHLREKYGDRLTIRVSLDHHNPAIHEQERGHAGAGHRRFRWPGLACPERVPAWMWLGGG